MSKVRRNIIVVIIALLVLTLASVFVTRAKQAPKTVVNAARPALTVTLVSASSASWDDALSLSGPLVAWQEAVVSAEISGLTITSVLVDVGTPVKRGQILATLSRDTVLAELRKQEAAIVQAKAALAEAADNAGRVRMAKDNGVFSEQKAKQYLVAEESAQASLASAIAQLDLQKIRLQQTTITAVDNGVISARTATLGAVVSAGVELFRLVRQGRVEWRAEVSAQQLSLVHPGQKVSVTLPGGSTVTGVVRVASPTLDATTRNALVFIDLPNRHDVRPGMYARGEILLGKRAASVVPQACIVQRDGRSYVFAAEGQGAVLRVKQYLVTTGRRVGDAIEVTNGLPQGGNIVAAGAAFLNDGDTVRVVQAGQVGDVTAPASQSGVR